MRKIYLLLLAVFCANAFMANAQILNQSANWPNPAWTITGSHATTATAFEADPLSTPNFAFDDDDAGSTAHEDNIAAESPVINLTAAHTGGETSVWVSVQYGYRYLPSDVLRFEYWNAATSAWTVWSGNIPENNTTVVDNFCTITKTTFTTPALDISAFTPAQLSGFRYRIFYDDNLTGTDSNYGFCFSSPVIKSSTCGAPANLAVANVTDSTANLSWASVAGIDGFEYVLNMTAADPASGTLITPNTYNAVGLFPLTTYYFHVRTDCTVGLSEWRTISFTTLETPPPNDECIEAITVPVNTDFSCTTTVAGTLVGATDSGVTDNGAGTPDDDVWFSFTATATTHRITLANVSGAPTDLVHETLSGTCTGLTSVLVSDANVSNPSGLVIGNVYYVRVFSWTATGLPTTNFTICVGSPPPPPANDSPTVAVALTVNADLACGVTTNGTTISATPSVEAVPSCSPLGVNDDVWYTFTATSTEHRFVYSSVTAGTMATALYTGAPGALVPVANGCLTGTSQNFGGLTVGTLYYARVYTTVETASTSANFTLCLGTPPPPPANDNMSGAVALTVNTGLTCTTATPGTTVNATMSTAATPCNGNPDDDVWYSFVATSTSHIVTLQTIVAVEGTSTDMYFQILGDVCGNLASLVCSDPDTTTLTGLTIGSTYYVRAYSYVASSGQSFQICITTPAPPPTPPANDNCANAVSLTVNATQTCSVTTAGTTLNATLSMAAGACGGNPDDDVWYSFVATNSSHIITLSNVVAVSGTATDMYFQVLSGTCCAWTSLLCSDPNTNTVTGLTAGNTYYIRVYSLANTSRQTFDICVSTPPMPPANDDCANAISLTVNPDYSCTSVTAGTTAGATQSMAATPCSGTADDDVWYSFVAGSTSHSVSLSDILSVTGTSTDMYFQVLSGVCGTLTSVSCSDPNSAIVAGLTIGSTYYVRVYSYGSTSTNTFNICIGTTPGAPANNECTGAVALNVNADDACGTVTPGTTAGATQSMAAAPCTGTSDDDVWFSFVATSVYHRISLQNVVAVAGTSTDMFFQVLSGACGSGTSVLCSDANNAILNELTIGDTYFVRVYSVATTASQIFNVCVGIPAIAPPSNDNCSNATVLTPGGVFADNIVDTSNVSATSSPQADPTTCNGYAGGDVWFSAVVPASGSITIETGNTTGGTSGVDTVFTIYSGTCGALTQVSCDDDGAATASYSMKSLTGLTPGSILYVRVYEYSNDNSGAFGISAYDASLANISIDTANFTFYPNPVKDILRIEYAAEISNVEIYNLLGQKMGTHIVNATQAQIDMSSLAAGTYLVRVSADNQTKTVKVIKE